MNALENQIKEMYEKSFYDIIDETISSDKPDCEWIIKLYSEIKGRLIKFIKPQSKVYKQIDTEFDVEFFRHMLENNVFDNNSLLKLVNLTFYWIKFLGAPARDKLVDDAKLKVLHAESSKIVSTFIREVNLCIDYIDEDIINYIKETKGL